MIKLLAWSWWQISNLLDRLPGFTDATNDLYNKDVRRHNDQQKDSH